MIEKIEKIQELLHVPNIDESTETAINNMKILNLLVDLRAEAEQLILSGVTLNEVALCDCFRKEKTNMLSGMYCKKHEIFFSMEHNEGLRIVI